MPTPSHKVAPTARSCGSSAPGAHTTVVPYGTAGDACARVDKLLAGGQNDHSMKKRTPAHFEARAKIVKALAHPTRLFIVDELSRKERCVAELTEMVGADMSTVSKHLSVLKAAGIVDDDKRGSQVIYFLRVPCILKFFDCVGEVLKSVAEQQLESLRDY